MPAERILISCPTCSTTTVFTVSGDKAKCRNDHTFTRPKCQKCGKSDQVFHIGDWRLVGTDVLEGQFACKRDVRDFTVKLKVA